MTISKEAVEAATLAIENAIFRLLPDDAATARTMDMTTAEQVILAEAALTAALPHLSPKPIQSDEDRAEQIARDFTPVDMGGSVKARTKRILAFASAVRAEATAATFEKCAVSVTDTEPACWHRLAESFRAAAIRFRGHP